MTGFLIIHRHFVFPDTVRERVAKQYVPGVSEVDRKRGLLSQTKAALDQSDQTDSENQSEVFKADDGKWRPVVVTLGIPDKSRKSELLRRVLF